MNPEGLCNLGPFGLRPRSEASNQLEWGHGKKSLREVPSASRVTATLTHIARTKVLTGPFGNSRSKVMLYSPLVSFSITIGAGAPPADLNTT
jgi:hypothetical protein